MTNFAWWISLSMILAFAAGGVSATTSLAALPFPNSAVRLLPGTPYMQAQQQDAKYLLWLDADRLLKPFFDTAGLPSEAEAYGGWEQAEVRGHFLGHYLSALSLMYAATGEKDFKQRVDYIVQQLGRCQAKIGTGYVAGFPDSFFDRLESGQNAPWASYYVIHKIMAGLLDAFTYCGNQQALEVCKEEADYFKQRCDKLSDAQMDVILWVEFGGMNEVLYNLYAITGMQRYKQLAHRFDQASFLGPLALGHDNLTGLHANTHIPVVIGAARRYELTGDEQYRDLSEFFWHRVVDHRTYATGGTSWHEHWGEPDKLADTIGVEDQECCTSYNMLKLTRHLFEWTPDARLADYYERVMLNSRLGTIHPSKLGWLCYFIPLGAGYDKAFGGWNRQPPSPDNAFWCCYGTGVEEFAKLQDSIFFHADDTLFVNQFIASKLEWPERGLKLVQQTDFPESDTTKLKFNLDAPVELAVKIRRPRWLAAPSKVTLNGQPLAVEDAPTGGWFTIRRTWHAGDELALTLPASLHAAPLPDDHLKRAFMYGPVVLAAVDCTDAVLITSGETIVDKLQPVPGKPLHFTLETGGRKLNFEPLNQVFDERYTVYFNLVPKGSAREQALLQKQAEKHALEARIIDAVQPLDVQSEQAHHLQSKLSRAGSFFDSGWRDAEPGGFFSWELKVLPDVPVSLRCLYWGSDVERDFEILVDGEKIAEQILQRNKPDKLFAVEYPLPLALTRGKDHIRVTFKSIHDKLAGGVFNCATLKPAE